MDPHFVNMQFAISDITEFSTTEFWESISPKLGKGKFLERSMHRLASHPMKGQQLFLCVLSSSFPAIDLNNFIFVSYW